MRSHRSQSPSTRLLKVAHVAVDVATLAESRDSAHLVRQRLHAGPLIATTPTDSVRELR